MSNNSTCVFSDAFYEIQRQFVFASYYVISPLHFFMAIPGHILLLLIFYHQYKEERAGAYQIFSSASELVELLLYVAYDLSVNIFSDFEGHGQAWFLSQYWLMWLYGSLRRACPKHGYHFIVAVIAEHDFR